jgi:hypothetical protein
VMAVAMLVASHSVADVLVLVATMVVVVIAGLPLARHLWNTPTNAPEYLPHRSGVEDQVAATIDRYSTRWGGRWADKEEKPQ